MTPPSLLFSSAHSLFSRPFVSPSPFTSSPQTSCPLRPVARPYCTLAADGPSSKKATDKPPPASAPHNLDAPAISILNSLSSAPQGVNFGSHRMRVFSGSSNPLLADDIARYVGKSGTSAMLRKRFADGETYVRIEESVRGCNVFLVQATSNPTNDHLIELLLMIDACRRASAHQITAVIPYYGYSRADRLVDPDRRRREALTSKLVANMLSTAGTDRIVLVDIHSPQTCGFFDIPVDHVFASAVLERYILEKKLDDVVVVAPDAGGVARARAFAKGVDDMPLAIIDKRRDGHNAATVLNLVGDVKGKTAILIDDMIDTAGTICEAAKMLRERGASQVFALATHAIFSGPAVERLSSGVFEEVIVTNTIYIPPEKQFKQLKILSIADLLGEQIWRVHEQSSR
eukprot:GFKZ01012182.1.p1 GENE.GFKZ01012182.1~~GFKZ01012182.1.p1  ORF type:complete len:402 (-),score=53.31 GFKZ01012182.1:116-1321(-)